MVMAVTLIIRQSWERRITSFFLHCFTSCPLIALPSSIAFVGS